MRRRVRRCIVRGARLGPGPHAAAFGLGLAVLAACRTQDPPPPLAVEGTTAPAENATADPAPSPPRTEGPWFVEGPGAQAMALRAQDNHAAALEVLARVAAAEGSADAAAVALLTADSQVAVAKDGADYLRAADAFATARAHEALAALGEALRVREAQARLDASDPEAALALLQGMQVSSDSGVGPELWLVRADAAARTGAVEAAVADYKRYLDDASADRKHEARAKLARVLEATGDGTAQREAAGLWAKLVIDVPLSDYADEARKALDAGAKARLQWTAKERRQAQRDETLATLQAQLKRRQYSKVEKAAHKEAARSGLPADYLCELRYLEGSAIFKQRQRPRARPVFEKAAKSCAKAKNVDLQVKTRYQAARGRYSQGQYKSAAKAFEALAKDFAKHSYADDAWIKAGEAWASHGDEVAARKAYEAALARHPDGDMRHEARRRAVLLAFSDSPQAALDTVERMLASRGVGDDERAKLLYFRARARARSKQDAGSVRADLLASLELRPLSYTGLQALSRLHEMSPEAYAEGMAKLEVAGEAPPAPSLALPGTAPDAEARAKLWSRLGFGDLAWQELRAVGIGGWPAAALLTQAGDFPAAQRRLADLGTGWRSVPPHANNRAHWELAHPRPFRELIDAGEAKHDVPPALTFAIMQTESRFDPNVVSWAGARGLVQLMPATAADLASRAGIKLGAGDLFEPRINLDLGMSYLGRLASRFGGGPGGAALAAPSYNAGAGSVDKWLAARGSWDFDLFIEAIPYDETRRYTQSVMGRWFAYRWLYGRDEARVPHLPSATPQRASK